MLKKITTQAGQSLIEILLVTVVVATILTAIAASSSMSAKDTAENKRRSMATSLVQESLELFHRERYAIGWESFQAALESDVYCLDAIPTDSSSFTSLTTGSCGDEELITGTEFQREVELTIQADEVKVVSTVTWLDGDKPKQVVAEQTFKDIQ